MTNDKHTPGPWRIKKQEHAFHVYARDYKLINNRIAAIEVFVDNAEANARLIAAAPELVEALQELWSASFERNQGREGFIRLQNAQMRASDILAKAKGEV